MIETGFVLGIVASVFLTEVFWGRRVGQVRAWMWGRRVPLLGVRSLLMIGDRCTHEAWLEVDALYQESNSDQD